MTGLAWFLKTEVDGSKFGPELRKAIEESSGFLVAKPRQTGLCNTVSEFKNINWEGFTRSISLITDPSINEESPDED